ncbi:MAG: ABC transporter ATP-binding protein, partial [Cyanobacteria bacterium J06636_16]
MTSPSKLPIRPLLWRLMSYTPKLALMDAGLWMLIAGVFPAVPGLIIQGFFDALADTAPLGLPPLMFLGLLVATSLGEIVAIFAGQWVRTQYRFSLRSLLRHNLLDKLLQQPGAQPLSIGDSQQQTISPGEAIAYFREDPELIEQTIAKTADLIGQGLFAAGAIALLLSINVRITLIVFLPLAVIAVAVQQAQQKIKQYRRASRQATQAVTGFLGEIFAAVQVLKATGTETAALNHLQQINQHRQHHMVKDQLLTTVLNSSFENLINLGIGLILLIVAIANSQDINSLSVGDFALFVYYLAFVTTSFRAFGQYLTLLRQTEVSFDRLTALHSEAAAT